MVVHDTGRLDHDCGSLGAVADPVCSMTVDLARAKPRAERAGHDYFFCSAKCRDRFTAEPAHYLAPRRQPALPRRLHRAGGEAP